MLPVFPTLITARFLLREITEDDLPLIFRGLSDPRVIAYYGISYSSLEETRRQLTWFRELYESGRGIWWGICRPDTPDELLGACGYNNWNQEHRRAEIGAWLTPENWKQGIMRECLGAILDYGFSEMKLNRVEGEIESGNTSSIRLVESLRFQLEGVRRQAEVKNGAFVDLCWYARLSSNG